MADLTHLDKAGMQAFVNGDLADFITAIDKIRKDDPAGARALKSLLDGRNTADTLQENPFLAIGLMAGSDDVHGASLITKVKAMAQSVDDIFGSQKTLFKDIDTDVRETIRTLLATQGDNLGSIDGEKLLDVFSDVDGDLSDTGGSGHSEQH
ncbi:type VII secretion system-associated protein [Streptomyces sp. NPDC048664]|uniref:type VII secretion system-associated protein n=1 Tax=Streptomyces sp. NPDC048664 TaxID=3154505 RepID=UPI00341C78DC